jgi:hypothetical protein
VSSAVRCPERRESIYRAGLWIVSSISGVINRSFAGGIVESGTTIVAAVAAGFCILAAALIAVV